MVLRGALGERTQLAVCHAGGAIACERVIRPDHGLALQAGGQGVEGLGSFDFSDHADLQRVLQNGP